MTPKKFQEANSSFRAPEGFEESQVGTAPAFRGEVATGSCEGAPLVVVAWELTAEEVVALAHTRTLYLSFLGGGLPAHFPSLNFDQATNPS